MKKCNYKKKLTKDIGQSNNYANFTTMSPAKNVTEVTPKTSQSIVYV